MDAWIIGGGLFLIGALVFAVVALRLSQGQGQGTTSDILADELKEMGKAQAALSERLAIMAENNANAQAAQNKLLQERLDKVSERMGLSLTQTATKTAESLGKLTTRLNVIDEAQKNITELSGQVVSLQDILSNKQARGAFGEIQMNDIVSSALPPSAYKFQTTLSTGTRPDCLLTLPNPPGPIVVDSKFPLESYHALRAASDEQETQLAARAFRASLLKHIQDISSKYIIPGETAESALMFLPSEAIYAELHTHFTDILQKSYEARVYIVSPTTFMATLNTVRAVLKDVQMREQAHIIQREVGVLAQDVGRLQGRVDKLQTHFAQAGKDIDMIVTSAGKISQRSERIEALQLGEEEEGAELNPVPPLRQIS